jgi:hypothetical protein
MNINLDFSCKNLDFSCITTPGIIVFKKRLFVPIKKRLELDLIENIPITKISIAAPARIGCLFYNATYNFTFL